MSRATLLLLLILGIIVGAAVALANMDTQVAPSRVEKDVLNEAAAQ